jgi:inosine/xanthosine triphosphate pyrophosphatase family protein
MKLLLGTGNPAKQARLRWLLEGLSLQLLTPADVAQSPADEEGSVSLRENAEQKASAWAREAGLYAITSDGGLHLPAIGERWNPVLTRRAAGPTATDADRAAHLVRLMADLRGEQRQACWVEVVALAAPDGTPVGSWAGVGDPWEVLPAPDFTGVSEGFWVPALMPLGQRGAGAEGVERHWHVLRPAVRRAVETLIRARG